MDFKGAMKQELAKFQFDKLKKIHCVGKGGERTEGSTHGEKILCNVFKGPGPSHRQSQRRKL